MVGPKRLLGTLLVLASLAACAPSVAEPAPISVASTTIATTSRPPAKAPVPVAERGRQSPGIVAAGPEAPYNYGPAVLAEGGRIRMWWCSQLRYADPPGDDLLYAESATPDGPFTAPDGSSGQAVLSGNVGGFDGMHVCDPSVLKVGDTYYLYYTGAAGEHAHGNAIGVATSKDGVHWTREAGGRPIVSPSYDTTRENTYGAGQPSVLFADGWFYLLFTDTTGRAAGWNGAGQFVLRAKNPTFLNHVEALGEHGFEAVADTRKPRTRSVVDAFSADWMYVDALKAFAIAHETEQGTTITFWNHDFSANPVPAVTIPGRWREGPGLVRTPDGHAPLSPEDPCHRVPLDVVRATVDGAAAAPTDLAHFGLDLANAPGCRTKDAAARVLDGYAVPSPENTVDVVVGGKVVRVERRSVADRLATRVLDRRPPIVDEMPVAARVPAGAKAVRAPNGALALLLEDKRWLVSAEDVMTLNSSTVTAVTQRTWDGYEQAGDLRR
ncbi:beta-xylosidase [Saccharothrix obliqua]|uniref:beta-xylosidase n=1 Tax=Saccharothrix obliqua TaxID=2861747 RepID=UPI001C5D2D6C|nr:beta-xylosidase [Saccharothrix obliqua]MBW4720988.1 family 43 glycosylhydrolase [Saccharothrix obliqua]